MQYCSMHLLYMYRGFALYCFIVVLYFSKVYILETIVQLTCTSAHNNVLVLKLVQLTGTLVQVSCTMHMISKIIHVHLIIMMPQSRH